MSLSEFFSYIASQFYTGKGDHLGKKELVTIQKCDHPELGRVAVKVFASQPTAATDDPSLKDEDGFERALAQAEKLKTVGHENIIAFYGVTSWPGFFGIVLELAECGNLESFLRSESLCREIPWWLRLRMLLDLFKALQYLHNYSETISIAHGGVKSSNILLTHDLIVKLGPIRRGILPKRNCDDDDSNRNNLDFLQLPKFEKVQDIYSAFQVAYEIITRCVITPTQFGSLIAFNYPFLNFTRLKEEIPDDSFDILFFNKLTDVMLKFIRGHLVDANANDVVEILSPREIDLYGPKQREVASALSKMITLRQRKSVSKRGTLVDVFRSQPNAQDATETKRRKKMVYFGSEDFPSTSVAKSISCSSGFSQETLNRASSESTVEKEYIPPPLTALAGECHDYLGCELGYVVKKNRCWLPPVAIQYVNETYAIVGKKGGTIQFLDGYIKIPEGALQDTREFLFMMLYGREHSKTPGVQVLTPTVGCVPSHNFRKEITVALPMCYFLDSPLPITSQTSTNGREWYDLEVIMHTYSQFLAFKTSSLSWLRGVNTLGRNKSSFTKLLTYKCYRPPNQSPVPYFIWEFRDEVMDHTASLKEYEGFSGLLIFRPGESLKLKLSSPRSIVEPVEKTVSGDVIFEQGLLLRETFRISTKNMNLNNEAEMFTYELTRVTKGKLYLSKSFPFPAPLSSRRLRQITPAPCSITTCSRRESPADRGTGCKRPLARRISNFFRSKAE
ncbi:uncharacterized protein LOC143453369 [Clavelina lepadiformis]|uniref:Protein kinase domain-containing protein n=1 Tax=Clavelina lepadiformis TaxID=159417 RepID=A0ABP0GUK9_CLALP